jgi:glucose-6-phosphate isomerase
MNAAVTPAAPKSAGTLETLKQGALQTVNWMGRQVQAFAHTVGDVAMRVINFMKPFFQNLAKVFGEFVSKARTFAMNNKEVTVAGIGGAFVISALALLAYFHYRAERPEEGATA